MKTFVFNGWAASPAAWSLCSFRYDRLFSYTDQLAGIPEQVLEREEGYYLVGWSMGGSSALRMLLKFPGRCRGLVLIAATPCMMAHREENWDGMTPRRIEAFSYGFRLTGGAGLFGLPEGRPNPYMQDTEERLEAGIRYLLDTDLRADLKWAFGASTPCMGAADFPVRIFQSRKDGIVRPNNAEFLKSIFPHAKLTWVDGTEHALSLTIPRLIDEAVNDIRECSLS